LPQLRPRCDARLSIIVDCSLSRARRKPRARRDRRAPVAISCAGDPDLQVRHIAVNRIRYPQVPIEKTWSESVSYDHGNRRRADVEFTTWMMRGEINRFRCDFWLKDRRHRLRSAWETAFSPTELRRV